MALDGEAAKCEHQLGYYVYAATSKEDAMAVMEEEDLDAVADAWGADEELIPGEPTEGLDEDMEGFENGAEAQGDEDEEGGWDMEASPLASSTS